MDNAKIRAALAITGGLFGLVGLLGLFAALVAVLQPLLGSPMALFIASALFLSVACLSLAFFVQPTKAVEDEFDDAQKAVADTLADLPMDVVSALVDKRPLLVTAMAAGLGYAAASNPKGTRQLLQRALMGGF